MVLAALLTGSAAIPVSAAALPYTQEFASGLGDIKALNAEYTGDVTVQYSYDGETFTDEVTIADFLVMDLEVLYAGLLETKIITFRFWLAGDATLTTFIMNYRNGDDDDGKTDGNN